MHSLIALPWRARCYFCCCWCRCHIYYVIITFLSQLLRHVIPLLSLACQPLAAAAASAMVVVAAAAMNGDTEDRLLVGAFIIIIIIIGPFVDTFDFENVPFIGPVYWGRRYPDPCECIIMIIMHSNCADPGSCAPAAGTLPILASILLYHILVSILAN